MASFWERLFGRGREPAPEPANDSEEDLLEDLREQLILFINITMYIFILLRACILCFLGTS